MTPSGPPSRFTLVRDVDDTGLSGTGEVAWGVLWPDGKVSTRWNARGGPAQTCSWDSIDDVRAVHGHDGNTRIVWTEHVDIDLRGVHRRMMDAAQADVEQWDDLHRYVDLSQRDVPRLLDLVLRLTGETL